ncbi:MAG: glycosyltransferase family 39 protein [Candidatus Tectomicrobia bacterium]|nr:glycosyltransferase family 39 protein [Candidatus Tectomicrobia bacterium]
MEETSILLDFMSLIFGAALAIFVLLRIQAKAKPEERNFLSQVFLLAFVLRALLACAIYFGNMQLFFGGDALGYDLVALEISRFWSGELPFIPDWVKFFLAGEHYGFYYWIAFFYYTIGRVPLLIQMFNCVLGALTTLIVYKIAELLFNRPVARTSAYFIALFPVFIIWSSQMLREAAIVFFINLTIYTFLLLRRQFRLLYFTGFLISIALLNPLRTYIFYILLMAILGAYMIAGRGNLMMGIIKRAFVVIIIGMVLITYSDRVQAQIQRLALERVLEQIDVSRRGLAVEGESGFLRSVRVSSLQDALALIPVGTFYVLLSPFPWEVRNFRQAVTLPETLLWWIVFPFAIRGCFFSLRHRFRDSLVILLFITGLILFYSVFQGNVGTIYRQRVQLQTFLFIFASTGFFLLGGPRAQRLLKR